MGSMKYMDVEMMLRSMREQILLRASKQVKDLKIETER
jgi:hypothetical protein